MRPIDGTTVPIPNTAANQARYPQSHSQKARLGLAAVLGPVCPSSGAILDAAIDPYRGKGGDEQSLLRWVLDWL
jgi:hypothetical protein